MTSFGKYWNKSTVIIASAFIFFFLIYSCSLDQLPTTHGNTDLVLQSEIKWIVDIETDQRKFITSFKKYDPDEKLIELLLFTDEGIKLSKSTFSYQPNKSTETKVYYSEAGSIDSTFIIYQDFNPAGNIIKRITKNETGDIIYVELYEYDGNGNLVKIKIKNSDGIVFSITHYSYKYNNSGSVIERLTNPGPGGTYSERDSLTYNYDDNKIDLFNFGSGYKVKSVHTYKYNSSGKVISEIVSTPDGNITRKYIFEYEYYPETI